MTPGDRAALKQAIDARRREQLFTVDTQGKAILRKQYRDPVEPRVVYGISHGTTWAYKQHKCRCDDCKAAGAEHERRRRLPPRTKEAA